MYEVEYTLQTTYGEELKSRSNFENKIEAVNFFNALKSTPEFKINDKVYKLKEHSIGVFQNKHYY